MKESVKWLIIALALVIVIGGAAILYNTLGENNGGGGSLVTDMPMVNDTTSQTDKTDAPDTEGEESTQSESAANPAPEFTVIDVNGNEVKLSDMRGKPVILNFWATWCGYCKMEMPDFDEMYKKYGDEIHFMMINVGESVAQGKSYIDGEGYSFPIYFDTTSEVGYNYGAANGIPLSYFIDANGNLVAHAMGAIDAEVIEKGIEMIK